MPSRIFWRLSPMLRNASHMPKYPVPQAPSMASWIPSAAVKYNQDQTVHQIDILTLFLICFRTLLHSVVSVPVGQKPLA